MPATFSGMAGVCGDRTACRPCGIAVRSAAISRSGGCRTLNAPSSSKRLAVAKPVDTTSFPCLAGHPKRTRRWVVSAGRNTSPPERSRTFDPANVKGIDDTQQIEALILEETEIPKTEQAATMAAIYVAAAFAFGVGVWAVSGGDKASEFFAGYLLEQSLSVDNLFVFILVFKYFRTPVDAQRKCLFWGILTAAVLRLVMIMLGVELISRFEPLLLVFAAILIFSSYKLVSGGDDDDDDDLSDNTVVKLCRRFIKVTDHYDRDNFLTFENGVRTFTPLVLVLAVIEISDVIFAVDSIPAVFGVTTDPFIIYTSNIFAIISLRGFYSFIAVFMGQLRFLDKAVALVLGFIGVKMVLQIAGYDIPTPAALAVVAGVLGTGVALSFAYPKKKDNGDDDAETAMSSEDAEQIALLSERVGQQTNNLSSGEVLVVVPDEPGANKLTKKEENGHEATDSLDRDDDFMPSGPVKTK